MLTQSEVDCPLRQTCNWRMIASFRIAHLDKVFGLPVKVGCKVIKDLDEAGTDGFPLGLRIFQALHAISLIAYTPWKQGPLSIYLWH